VLQRDILTKDQILEIASKTITKIDSFSKLYDFINEMKVAKDDEIVYLDEKEPKPLNWDDIHKKVISLLSLKL
jgi:hypothetical protein